MIKTLKKLLKAFLALGLLAALAVAAAGYWAWQKIHQPHRGWPGDTAELLVEPGTPALAILDQLERRGVIADRRLARLYLVYRLEDPPLLAGEYRFDAPLTTPQALDKLIRGRVVTHPVTLIEGLTFQEVAEALAGAGFGELDTLLAEMSDPGRIADLDPEADNLEGYLYPDTYHFARGTGEKEIIDTLVQTFRRRYEKEVAPLLLDLPPEREPRLDLRQLVTLASIVEKETQLEEERPIVASVYSNRLRIGMGLYADPTIIYGKKLDGTWDGNLRRADLRSDSPYNTYRVPGLPPSPICSPSLPSLLAALAPAETDYLYFVSRNDGSHVFARTKAEHDRNVYKWQKLYWRKRWAEQRRQRAAGAPEDRDG